MRFSGFYAKIKCEEIVNACKEESKLKRKIFALILSIAVLITSLPFYATAVFASSPTIGISSAEAQPGDSVDLTVSITGNPGITSIDFSVQYDEKQFELTAKKNGKLLGGTMNSQTLDKVPYYCGWINSLQKENCKDDGVLITLTFKVKDGAVNGKQEISFTQNSVTGYDADIKAVSFTPENGYIEVKNGKEPAKPSMPSGGGGGTAPTTPAGPSEPTQPGDKDDGNISPSEPTTGGDKALTAAQQKTIAKVKAMKIIYTSAKYSKAKKSYTLKYKRSNKAYKLDGYQIYRSTKVNKGFKKAASTSRTTWTDKKVGKKGTVRYYKVRGFRKIAGKTYYTNWSVKKKLTV